MSAEQEVYAELASALARQALELGVNGYTAITEQLANAVLAAEAAREAEAVERAKDIDEEWLLSIGFTLIDLDGTKVLLLQSKHHAIQVRSGKVLLARMPGPFIQLGLALTTKRCMILDTLAGLLIPVKGGGK